MFIKTGGNVGIGTTNPITKLHVFGNGGLRVTADSDANAGFGLMLNNQPKWSVATTTPGQFQIFNDALGQNAVWIDPTTNNVGIGVTDPNTYRLDVSSSSGGLRVASSHPGIAIAEFVSDGAILFGRPGNTPGDKFRIIDRQNGPIINRGIVEINNPQATLTSADTKLIVNGYIRINAPALGVGLPVCQEPVTQNLVLCAVSSRRYKKNIQDFNGGLDMISRLRPVTFDWKRNDQHDFGLVAEEVEEVNPLLVHYDADGQVLGIKYDHIGVIAINAIKEQQAQIEAQQKLIADQQRQIDELKKLVCLTNRTAGLCREEK
jgi:hypothetical protein